MLSLIRKISSSQQSRELSKGRDDKGVNVDGTGLEQDEVDGTTYDPNADPRDPERYYTFPHFSEDKQEDAGTPDENDKTYGSEQARESHAASQTTPTSNSTTGSQGSEPVSPPFWPVSPVLKRLHSNQSPGTSHPALQRRATTNLTPSPHSPSRTQPARRSSAQVQAGQNNLSPSKIHSSTTRSVRAISATRRPEKNTSRQREGAQSPTRELKQQRCGSAHTQGSPKGDGGRRIGGA